MQISDLLTLIGIIIALAAYVATVRGRILDKARNSKEPDKSYHKRYAKLLMCADVPLIISGAALGIHTARKIVALNEPGWWFLIGIRRLQWLLLPLYAFTYSNGTEV